MSLGTLVLSSQERRQRNPNIGDSASSLEFFAYPLS